MEAQAVRLERLCVFNYVKTAGTATKLLTNFGRTIQHIAVAEGIYDPEASEVTNTETSTDCIACDFDFKANQYDGDLVQFGDRYAIINNAVSNIDVSDKLVIDSVRWSIVKVEKIAPAGTLVMWKVQIRR